MIVQEDRTQVQTLLGVNMVVEAGAGTGKTSLLIDRLCLCVLAQGTAVEKLVALTFTEKAAAEIKTRFIFKLQHLVQAIRTGGEDSTLTLLRTHFSVPDETLVSRAETALARLDRASIGTIHGFCADILKAYPLEAGLSPNVQIDSGAKATRLFDARWNSFLDEELGVNAPRAAAWKQVLPEISLTELKDFARELCSGKIENYDYYAHRDMLSQVCLARAARAEELVKPFTAAGKKLRNGEKALLYAADSLRRSAAFLAGQEVTPPPEETCPALPANAYKDWDEEDFEEARSLCAFASKITPEKQTLFLAAYYLVKDVAAAVRGDYLREGLLSFDDLIVKTRNLLKQNLYVRRLLKEKFDALFIDEFQDTDPVQGELLLFLAEEKATSATRWQEVRLAPGKLFVVGDPKQSIYRFRGADITAYELFTDLILKQGGKKCFLQKNFRSVAEIVDLANAVCARSMRQQPSFQPAYVPIFTDKTTRSGAAQWLFIPPADPAPVADDYRDNQAEQIAAWIKQQVGTLELAEGRKLTYADIALLTRASTTAGPYTDALRRHGIPFNVETDKDFYRKQEVNDFLNFLRAAINPEDRTALAGILRSPVFGFTDEEIYQIARRGELSLYARPQDEKLAQSYQFLRQLGRQMSRQELRQNLQTVLEETLLPEACAAAYEGERTLANLSRLVHLAKGYAADGPASLLQFLAEVQTLLEETPERLGAASTEDALDAVSVMTVHKSKGLQFPVVILADLSKKESSSAAHPTAHLFSWRYNMHGLRAGRVCDANLAFLEDEQKKHERCEEIRILYVALTRAKEKLLLTADGRKGAAKAAAPFALAGLFPDGDTDVLTHEALTVPVSYQKYRAPETFRYLHVAPSQMLFAPQGSTWRAVHEARAVRYQALISGAQNRAPSELLQTGRELTEAQRIGAELGTVCHGALERFLSGRTPALQQAVAEAASSAGAPLRASDAQAVLGPFVASPLYTELSACKFLAGEMPFSFLTEEGNIESGVMDAVLECPDSSIWVVDYKTDKVEPGQERQLLEEKYRLQLGVYQAAAQKLFAGRPVRCSAVFIRTFAAVDL